MPSLCVSVPEAPSAQAWAKVWSLPIIFLMVFSLAELFVVIAFQSRKTRARGHVSFLTAAGLGATGPIPACSMFSSSFSGSSCAVIWSNAP